MLPRSSVRATLAAALLCTACSQPAAMVDLKGQNSYGRTHYNSQGSYADYTTSDVPKTVAITTMPTQQPVAVQTVTSSDLAPPSAAPAKVASNAKVAAAKPVTVAQASPATPVNHWTNKPHYDDTQTVQVSDNGAPVNHAAPVKPATVTAVKTAYVTPVAKAAPAAKTIASSQNFIWPVNGKKIISGFGPKSGGKVNDGINIAADNGEPVWAAADGEVVYVGNELQGYGNMVLIKHANGKTTSYAHLSSATVEKYDRIKQGDIIGYVGSTGNVKEPQLHFAIRDGKDPVDPRKYLSQNVAGL